MSDEKLETETRPSATANWSQVVTHRCLKVGQVGVQRTGNMTGLGQVQHDS